jgi:c(7)-type cytochrome triheme protein
MKKLIVLLMIMAFAAATVAIAADTYTYEGKQGNVTFNHKAHGDKLGCKDCHGDAAPAKIAVTKDSAHGAVCKDCHKAKNAPNKCGDCHKK